jgi:hypothetical protein
LSRAKSNQRFGRVPLRARKKARAIVRPKIAVQREFSSIDDFKKNCANFLFFFITGEHLAKSDCLVNPYRRRQVFMRFARKFPALEAELTEALTRIHNSKSSLEAKMAQRPWGKLLKAYNLMRQLVYVTDKRVIFEKGPLKGKVNSLYLII